MCYFTDEIAKGNAAAAAHRAAVEAWANSPEGQAQIAEDLAEETAIIEAREAEIKAGLAAWRAERRAEHEACFNTVRAPYTGAVVARYRVR